jgi:peptide-methionine (S)-S-oxide reductase
VIVRNLLLISAVFFAGTAQAETATAIFAGGCFWCMEEPFDVLPGVLSTTSGYIGGHVENPTYKQVSSGSTGHTEAVRVAYDPDRIEYAALLDVFWHNIDPTVKDRQFCDRGSQYRSVIFVATPEERRLAEASRERVAERLGVPIHTEISDAGPFYPAEDYHQDYYRKNPIRYRFYRRGCGRDARLAEIWGDAAPGH